MKTRLIWRKSWMNENKDSFWVECTDQEVNDFILPIKSDLEFIKEIKINRGHSHINKNQNEAVICNFFLISKDVKFIKSFRWQYPYAGMWNASNPFEEINLFDFENLKELGSIFKKLKQKKKES